MRILFVCTGNTCRSPMAAILARRKIKERGLDWQADSAGLYAMEGEPMTLAAISAVSNPAKESDKDEEAVSHLAQSVTGEHVEQSNLILTMTAHHAWELRRRYPQFAGKIQALGAFVQQIPSEPDPQYDIVDPYGGSDEQYRETAQQLNALLDLLLDRLTQPSQPN